MHLNFGELLESDSRLVEFLKGERAKQKTTGRRGKKPSLDRNAMGCKVLRDDFSLLIRTNICAVTQAKYSQWLHEDPA